MEVSSSTGARTMGPRPSLNRSSPTLAVVGHQGHHTRIPRHLSTDRATRPTTRTVHSSSRATGTEPAMGPRPTGLATAASNIILKAVSNTRNRRTGDRMERALLLHSRITRTDPSHHPRRPPRPHPHPTTRTQTRTSNSPTRPRPPPTTRRPTQVTLSRRTRPSRIGSLPSHRPSSEDTRPGASTPSTEATHLSRV